MKRFLLIILLCTFALPAFAEYSGLPDGVRANLTAIKKYPKASSILLWVRDFYTLDEQGQQTYERHEFRYLPDEAARDLWGDPHIAYDMGREDIEIITARTYTADGRTIDATPHNAYNPVTPDNLDHAPDFANFKHMVVTLLGLENGCIAELHYKLSTKPLEAEPPRPWLCGRVYFREEVPVIARELVVQLPADKALTYANANGVAEPIKNGHGYVWRMDEQPGYNPDDLHGHKVLLPNVAFTTAKDWNEVSSHLSSRISFNFDAPEMPRSLQEKLAGVVEPENKLDTIKAWVRERFNPLEFEHPSFNTRLRPTSRVLNSGYGNSLELAVMVSNFARIAGVPAGAVAWYAFEPPVPYLLDVTGGLLHVKTDSEEFWCDPLAPRSEFPASELADATILSLDRENTLQKPKALEAKNSELRINVNMDELDADTLRGTATFVAHGWHTPYEALRTDASTYLSNLLHLNGLTVASIQLKQLEPSYAAVSFAFTAERLDTVEGSQVFSANLMNFAGFAGDPNLTLESKEFPQWAKLPGQVSVHLEAPLPDGWTVAQQPIALSQQWPDGNGSRTVTVQDGRVVLDEELTLNSAWIQPQGWSAFRSFLLETGARPNNILVFSEHPN